MDVLCIEIISIISIFFLMVGLTLILVSNLALALSDEHNKTQAKLTAGWLERVVLEPWNIKLRAKLDSGAKTSSLHAVDIQRFERDGNEWVRFRTIAPKENKVLKLIEMPLVRDVKIKRHTEEMIQLRPVVEMAFCLDGQVFSSEFSLIDRSQFHYPVLLGRRMLEQGVLIDPASIFTLHTNRKRCKRLLKVERKKGKK